MLIHLSNHEEKETKVKDAFEIQSMSDIPSSGLPEKI